MIQTKWNGVWLDFLVRLINRNEIIYEETYLNFLLNMPKNCLYLRYKLQISLLSRKTSEIQTWISGANGKYIKPPLSHFQYEETKTLEYLWHTQFIEEVLKFDCYTVKNIYLIISNAFQQDIKLDFSIYLKEK